MLLILNAITKFLFQKTRRITTKMTFPILVFCVWGYALQAQDGIDCISAKLLCSPFYHEVNPNYYFDNNTDEVGDGTTCMYDEEEAVTWYAFTAQRSGKLGFHIIPQDPDTDLDWALFDLTNASCEDLQFNAATFLKSCNAAGGEGCHGTTGMTEGETYDIQGAGCNSANPSQTSGYWPFNALVDVTEGHYYVLAVQNWTYFNTGNVDTYVIDFWLTDEDVIANEAVTVTAVETTDSFCEQFPITLSLNIPISCDILQNLDIRLENALLVDLPATPFLIDCIQGSEYTTDIIVQADFRGAMPGQYFLTIDDNTQNRLALASECGSLPDLPYRTSLAFAADTSLIVSIQNRSPNNNICAGESIMLRAQELFDFSGNLNSYLWTLPNGRTEERREIEATLAGEYKVDVLQRGATANPGCQRGTATFYLEGDFELDLGTDIEVCSGESVQLNAPLGGNSYQWNNGTDSPNITVQEAGLYILQVETDCGVYRDSIEVRFQELLQFSAAETVSVCAGESAQIGESFEGDISYLWSTGAGTPFIEVSAAGIYRLSVSNACNSIEQEFRVEQTNQSAQELEIFGTSLICPNTSTELRSSLEGNYTWSTGETTQTISVSEAGTYGLAVALSASCFTTAEIEVKHYPKPSPEILTWPTCSEDGTSYYIQVRRNPNYEFTINEGEIRIGTNGTLFVYVPLGKRLILGILDQETACQHYKFFGAPLCIPDPPMLVSAKAKVAPNPFTTSLTFQRPVEVNSNIQIFDLNGRLLLTTVWEEGLEKEIDLSQQASGIYFYKIISPNASEQGKILKVE